MSDVGPPVPDRYEKRAAELEAKQRERHEEKGLSSDFWNDNELMVKDLIETFRKASKTYGA